MSGKTFVYTELQVVLPFAEVLWRERNAVLLRLPGLVNKTWLAGVNGSVGGFYEFDHPAHATAFVTDVFPEAARRAGVAQTSRLFDGEVVEEASRDMGSVHFGAVLPRPAGAFVYTEVQIALPFAEVPWRAMNPVLKAQPGILAKTWLAGRRAQTAGGIYAFDTLDNARRFALDYFPTEAAGLGAAFTTRLFDAASVAEASRAMRSPFFND